MFVRTGIFPPPPSRRVTLRKRDGNVPKLGLGTSRKHEGKPGYVNLSNVADYEKLPEFLGKEVIVFGSIGNTMLDKSPLIIRIPVRKNMNFDLVIKERDIALLSEIDLDILKEYYIYAKGKVEMYDGRYQIVLKNKEQIWMD
jgi:hypothetical protein